MKVHVGTSGWYYSSWNPEGTLDWYIKNSGLNAIELNASFYRFPFPNQVGGWSKRGSSLTWVVKVNRLITHVHILNKEAMGIYERFLDLFKPLDKRIELYLFQMSPRFTTNLKKRVEDFVKSFDETKIAFEFRNESWYNFDFNSLDFKGVIVSPDSPEFNGRFFNKNNVVYVRFHGRKSWYSYKYSNKELAAIANEIKRQNPSRAFGFFNNNHDMLNNAREFIANIKK